MSIAELITSIANKIKGIKDNVLASYDAVANKGGEVPEEKTIANLPAAIASTHDTLEELTITANGTYTPQEGVDGFSKVTAEFDTSSLPKAKVITFRVTNDCINEEGRWEGERLIDCTTLTSLNSSFKGCTKLLSVDTNVFVVSNNVTNLYYCFFNTGIKRIDCSNWDVSNVTNLSLFVNSSYELTYCDVSNWNTRKVTTVGRAFNATKIETIDFSSWELPNVVNMTGASGLFYGMSKLTNFIGGKTIEDVLNNNITALKDVRVSIDSINSLVDRASIRALINGLADLTGQTAQTLTLGATLMAKLTEEDIAIATNKNWTIV